MALKKTPGQKGLVKTYVNFIAAMHGTFVQNCRRIVWMQL